MFQQTLAATCQQDSLFLPDPVPVGRAPATERQLVLHGLVAAEQEPTKWICYCITVLGTVTPYIQRPSREGILQASVVQQERACGSSRIPACSANTSLLLLSVADFVVFLPSVASAAWLAAAVIRSTGAA